VVTVRSTVAADSGGVTHVIDVALTTTTFDADTVPSFTVAPAINPVPVIVTFVPPVVGPAEGLIDVTTGIGLYVY
jgi:hypothetical protein